jgi:hypothetical protein
MPRTATTLLACLLAAVVLGGCSVEDEVDQARRDLERRYERARADVRREYEDQRAQIEGRVREFIAQIEQAIPEAQTTDPTVRTRGRDEPQTIDSFMEDVLRNVDSYWTRTLRRNGLPAPSVRYEFFNNRFVKTTACGITAARDAAFYCPADDTIYVSQQFAHDLYRGVSQGLPGQSAGYGRASGDFAVAYVIAHEYAHNLQQEFGIFDNAQGPTARPYELQADCWAGTWANSVFAQGDLVREDLDEILNAALAVGDFDVGNEQHHGTPEERREAVLDGFRTGDPSVCRRYVPDA